ncbi:hypothetical protein RhiirB3_454346 [Rhizophagus irregularis]|nr:hypothetical protein RhiirB3_454346 [Rhizophagus irregularis]
MSEAIVLAFLYKITISSEEVVKTAKNLNFTHDDSNDVMILSNENDHVLLCSEKRFRSWEECEEFTEDGESDLDELDDINHQEDETSNKENIDPLVLILRNTKKRYSKGQPLGTKRFKSSTEIPKPKIRNQRHCRKLLLYLGIRSITITFGGTICWGNYLECVIRH